MYRSGSNILARAGGWGGLTVIIMLISVQVELHWDLPTGTELGKNGLLTCLIVIFMVQDIENMSVKFQSH